MSGKKKIGIFELSELFGITPAAIRKYEGKGIIRPERNKENMYRKYSSWEVVKMLYARGLSKEGFSLNQVSEMLGVQDPIEHVDRIEKMQTEIAREIVYKKRLITLLDRQKKMYDSRKVHDNVQIEYMPALYCREIIANGEIDDGMDDQQGGLKAWITALPFVSVYIIHSESHDCRIYMGITEEERKAYDLEDLVPDFTLPERMCVTCNIEFDREGWHKLGKIDKGFEAAKSLGIPIEDVCIMKMYAYIQNEGKYTCHVKGYFPIAE